MKFNAIFRLWLASTLATETIASVCRPKYPNYPLLPSDSKDISIQTTAPFGISQTLTTAPVSEPTLLTSTGSTKPAPGGIFLSESAPPPGVNLPSDVSLMTSVLSKTRPSLTGESTEGNPTLSREKASTSGLPSEGISSSQEASDSLIIPSGLVEASSGGNTGVASFIIPTDTDGASQDSQTQTEDRSSFSGFIQTQTPSLTQDASTLLDTHPSVDISPLTSEIPGSSVNTEFHGFPIETPTSDVLEHPSGDIPLPSAPTNSVTLSDELSSAPEVSESSFSLPETRLADTTNSLSGPEITASAESSHVLASGQPSGSSPSAVATPDPAEDVSASGTLTRPSSIGSDSSTVTATDISPDTTSPVVSAIDSSIPVEGSHDSQTGATSHRRSESTDTLPPLDTTPLIHSTELSGTPSPADSTDTSSPLGSTSSSGDTAPQSTFGEGDTTVSVPGTAPIKPTTGEPEAITVAPSDVSAPILSADTTTFPSVILIPTDIAASHTSALSKAPDTPLSATETHVQTPSPTKDEVNDGDDEDNNNDDQDDDDDDDDDGPPIIPIPIPIDPKKPGDGKGGNKPSDTKPTNLKSTQEPSKSTDNAESTSSCSTSISVTWESVLCTVTAAVTTGTPACTTQAFTTVVSCSGTTASTTTSTTTVQPAEPTWACSPSRCGGGKCTVAKRGLIDRTTYPPKCKWAGPGNYEDPANFMSAEGGLAKSLAKEHKQLSIVPLPSDGSTSSKRILFSDLPVSLSIPHLTGCTSIIVVSKRGAWANHIWEEPAFKPFEAIDENEDEDSGKDQDSDEDERPIVAWHRPQLLPRDLDQLGDPLAEFPAQEQLDFFKLHALERLHTPYDPTPTDAKAEDHEFGLDDLRRDGGIFDDESDPHIYFFLPYKIINNKNDVNYNKENPVGLPAMWDKGGAPSPRADEDGPSFNDQLRTEMAGIFPDIPIETVMYAPDVKNDFADDEDINPRGRAIVQYQPGNTSDCDTKAKWRIFFEKQLEPMKEVEWTPLLEEGDQDSQWCNPSGGKKLRARAACEISATASLPSLPTLIGSIIDVLNPTKPSLPDFTQLLPSALPTETPTSESTAPATTSTAAEADPTQPTTPFADTGRTDCYDADSFSHGDTTSDVFVEVTEKFCKSLEGTELDSDSDDIYELYKDSASGEQYAYTVSWVDGCVTDRKSQELTDPTEMGSPNCKEMFGSSYHFCNEDGPHLGGTTQFGCVQYDVKAGWTGEN
ncbi:hypothetical protein FANTH_9155 [Fusarium anthophilum]|uniref:Uncharacterized protein n=1 Tax=Fusarium anthophilum TaxID=48485 RepID=A0A8H4Z8D5_9HYPO|nr:hypothetical protein FANTH_9155 [Fusarium anthophilum]